MFRVRDIAAGAIVGAIVLVFSAMPASAAEHLDKHDTRLIVRRLQERSDVLLDRIDSWVAERRDERAHRAEELIRVSDHYEDLLTHFDADVQNHDEPWELRDKAQEVLKAAEELGHVIEHGEGGFFHEDLRHEWEDMRDRANELAKHYHLPEMGR